MQNYLQHLRQYSPIRDAFSLYLVLVISIWSLAMIMLMKADVWDETNALLIFKSWQENFTYWEALTHIWTQAVANLYRPLPLSIAYTIDYFMPDRNTSWHVLRGLNILLLIATFTQLLLLARKLSKPSIAQEIALPLVFFGSGSVIISSGWFANIFDVFTIFLLLSGIRLLLEKRWKSAFVIISLAFYCKEISILIFPLIFFLTWSKSIEVKKGIIFLVFLIASFFIYIALRQNIVPIGSDRDIHGFDLSSFPKTLYAWFESLWWQNTRRESNTIAFLISILFFISLKNIRVLICTIGAMVLCSIIYLGMLPYSTEQEFTYLVFQSRLYLIPAVLLLFIAAVWGRTWTLYVILVPTLMGGWQTYSDYSGFQSVYAEIYEKASISEKQFIVHYPESPLEDNERNLLIGNYPDADYRIDAVNARLIINQ